MSSDGRFDPPVRPLRRTAARGPLSNLAISLDWMIRAAVVAGLYGSALSISVIVILGTADTLGRALLHRPLLGTVEVTEALLAAAIFLALAYAQQRAQHVSVDILSQTFRGSLKRIVNFVILVLTLVVFLLLAWRGFDLAQHSWNRSEISAGLVPVPIWASKIAAAVGLFIAVLETLRQIIWHLIGRDIQEEARNEQKREMHTTSGINEVDLR